MKQELLEITTKLGITKDHIQNNTSRWSYDEVYMQMAEALSRASHDANTGHGCVVVKNNRVIACGLNGFPKGSDDSILPNCRVNGDSIKLEVINHAEQNLIYDAADRGISLSGSTAFLTGWPCKNCTKALVSVGIKNWIIGDRTFKESEQDALWRSLWIKMHGVTVRKYVTKYLFSERNSDE